MMGTCFVIGQICEQNSKKKNDLVLNF